MKFYIFLVLILLFLSSCGSETESLTKKTLERAYDSKERSVDLSDRGINGFVSLNELKPDIEVGNLYLSDNAIEVLNISEYVNVGKLELQNNNIRFLGDINFPQRIRQLDLSFNQLENLDGIEELTELQTLNVSYNKLDEEDFKKLAGLTKLRLVYVDGNDVSVDFMQRIADFNSSYLSTIKQ